MKPDRVVQLGGGVDLDLRFVKGGILHRSSHKWENLPSITIPNFYLGIYPVTNAQYAVFLNAYGQDKVKDGPNAGQKMIYEHQWGLQKTPYGWRYAPGYERHPVMRVTWYGAYTFCIWLSEQTGKSYRLLSESEWEYAARGGELSQVFKYAGSNRLEEVGWYNTNSHGATQPVGLKAPNELYLYDMSGNVWEWCQDDWHYYRSGAPQDGSAWEEEEVKDYPEKVRRGGSWNGYDNYCRVSDRYSGNAINRNSSNIGFRIAGD